jgi:hypothetical protein
MLSEEGVSPAMAGIPSDVKREVDSRLRGNDTEGAVVPAQAGMTRAAYHLGAVHVFASGFDALLA